jgi:hypothetical protein
VPTSSTYLLMLPVLFWGQGVEELLIHLILYILSPIVAIFDELDNPVSF